MSLRIGLSGAARVIRLAPKKPNSKDIQKPRNPPNISPFLSSVKYQCNREVSLPYAALLTVGMFL